MDNSLPSLQNDDPWVKSSGKGSFVLYRTYIGIKLKKIVLGQSYWANLETVLFTLDLITVCASQLIGRFGDLEMYLFVHPV